MKHLVTILIAFAVVMAACKKDDNPPSVPSLTTTAATNISYNAATTGGVITSNGGAAITESGIVWSKTNNTPTTADSIKTGTTSSGSFTFTLSNLEGTTAYYVRAYAKNSAGTGYGNVVTFSTSIDTTKVTFTYNGSAVTYGVITSPTTGRKWMDRNLGASRAATAYDDYQAYGDLFQWGRPADGHQLITWTNSTTGTAVNGKTATLATSDIPGNNLFITPDVTVKVNGVYIYDWRADQNNNRWAVNSQGPCPAGWHVPTHAEWQAETGLTNATTSFNQLKITLAGYRYGEIDGTGREGVVRRNGILGYYWSSSISPFAGGAYDMDIESGNANDAIDRCFGYSVRCIRN
jgi:uncharacterized protein (TIGR02145 family)